MAKRIREAQGVQYCFADESEWMEIIHKLMSFPELLSLVLAHLSEKDVLLLSSASSKIRCNILASKQYQLITLPICFLYFTFFVSWQLSFLRFRMRFVKKIISWNNRTIMNLKVPYHHAYDVAGEFTYQKRKLLYLRCVQLTDWLDECVALNMIDMLIQWLFLA
jgi:uncharacterized protein YybS (DUF2232 family)